MVKALHPSDPITTCSGVPDESSFPTVSVAYQQTFKVTAPSLPGDPLTSWGVDFNLMPDVIHMGSMGIVGPTGQTIATQAVLNPQLTGATYSEKFDAFIKLKPVRHRLMYCGVTVTLDAPALANQGTVVACQHAVDPDVFNVVSIVQPAPAPRAEAARSDAAAKPRAPALATTMSKHLRCFPLGTMISYDQAMGMPNTLVGQAKDGVYMPLRLSETSQEWVSLADLSFVGAPNYSSAAGEYYGDVDYRVFTAANMPDAPTYVMPYASCRAGYVTDTGSPFGDLIYRPLNAEWGYLGFRNLSINSSLSFTIRMGIEAEVLPSSILAPYQKSSPEYDPQALQAYFHISRQLKDAYPADYNDLAKLWGVIKSAAQAAMPFLGALGPYGAVAGAAIPAAIGVVDKLSASYMRSKKTKGFAALESAREGVSRALAAPSQAKLRAATQRVRQQVDSMRRGRKQKPKKKPQGKLTRPISRAQAARAAFLAEGI